MIASNISIKNPNVTIVIGNVRIIKIGLTKTFKIDNTILAIKAVLKSAIKKMENKKSTAISAIAFKNMDVKHLINNFKTSTLPQATLVQCRKFFNKLPALV